MKTTSEKWPALWVGMDQIPTNGLELLHKQLLDKNTPLTFCGKLRHGKRY